ncbi:DUF6214 family protein [Streptomyces sp. NPDC018693]|uniref:DUF6214 family protein n=1 Tax=unclassified Streptomyces TaxID=2593676 RepID=UPI0037A6CB26
MVAQEYRAGQEEGVDPVLAVIYATGYSRRAPRHPHPLTATAASARSRWSAGRPRRRPSPRSACCCPGP